MGRASLRAWLTRRYNAIVLNNPDPNDSSAEQSSKRRLRGLLLPIPTPFHADGAVNLDGLRSNIGKWNETGISGYVVLGSSGERVHLDEAEYAEVIATARVEVPADLVFIAGVGQQSTIGTIKEIKRVAAMGTIDGVLIITPHFYRASMTQAALLDYYREVADASPVPIILYSMPTLTGIIIEPETAARLSEHQNIAGIKDSSADIEPLRQTAGLVSKDFAVLTGNGPKLDQALTAGAVGGILSVGSVAPALTLEIMRAVRSGDTDRAALLQPHLSPLAAAITTRFGIGGLKAALEMIGLVGGPVRAPLRVPDEEARHQIRLCLEEATNALEEISVTQTQQA
jgi:4-hydroxy-2-oxoglutarate aldolase